MLISLNDIEKSFGDRLILKSVDLCIHENDRIGLIGRNGSGKTTLLSIIAGNAEPDKGSVCPKKDLTIGYLEQNAGLASSKNIAEEMQGAFAQQLEAGRRMQELSKKLSVCAPAESRSLSAEYSRLAAYFEASGGYTLDVQIKTVLTGMGFAEKDMEMPVSKLSGGEKTRLALAKMLLMKPELLILDEPTNHLDVKTLYWLEDYLSSYKGALLTVSHDRYFLDRCVDIIWDVEGQTVTAYRGNYTKFKEQKQQRNEYIKKEYDKQQLQMASMKEYAEKNIARATTSKSAKSRLARLAQMDVIEAPVKEARPPKFRFEYSSEPVKDVLTVKNLDLCAGDLLLAEKISFCVSRGGHLAIIGANGTGKSTLMRMLAGLIPFKGEINFGRGVKLSYYDQESARFSPENSVLYELSKRFPSKDDLELRSLLGTVLITGDDVYKKVGSLSGGEKAKLGLALVMAEKGNVLLLDEPTNHLDLESREALEKALLRFTGTLIFVSHDRYFVNAMSPEFALLEGGRLELRQGSLEQLMSPSTPKPKEPPQKQPGENAFYRSRQQRAEDTQKKKRLMQLELVIESNEQEQKELQSLIEGDAGSDYLRLQQLCEALSDLKEQHEKLLSEWMELN